MRAGVYRIRSNRLAAWVATLLLLPATARAGYRADVTVVLDQPAYPASQPVRGVVKFRLYESPKTGSGPAFVSLNDARIMLVKSEDDRSAVLTSAAFSKPLPSPVRVGQVYDLPFKLDAEPAFRKAVAAVGAYRLFHPGVFRVRASVLSLPRPPDAKPPVVPVTYAVGQWSSEWTAITVKDDRSPMLGRDHVFDAVKLADSPLKEDIIIFYAKAGVLAPDDVVRLMAKSPPRQRAKLIAFYTSQKYPLDGLDFFEPAPAGEITLKGHAGEPFFIVLKPSQTVKVRVNDPDALHTFETMDYNSGTIGLNRLIEFQATRTQGLYPVRCRKHDAYWGWFLVRKAQTE
jgi:hypothetical protein